MTPRDLDELVVNRAGIWRLFVLGNAPISYTGRVSVGNFVHLRNGRLAFGAQSLWVNVTLRVWRDVVVTPSDARTFDTRYVQTGDLTVEHAYLDTIEVAAEVAVEREG